MCSQKMDNYQGDLTDIVRASGGANADGGYTAVTNWQFPSNPINCSPDTSEYFGDPFSYARDPLHNLDPPLSGFVYNPGNNGGFASDIANKVLDDEMKRPPNMFSRMLQISPNAKLTAPPCEAVVPPGLKGPPPILLSNNLQISSPRNTGIKRRKSQAKKVVCIPAPAPANSRSTGEIVPSDLWAWRKYGQKPIKGSPYPRGYYRCSSSKGCSARKQVERSRTDPNMLVITYTSEHNHPWPTQRNALAGSTRSQPSKSTKPANPKEETNPDNTSSKPDPTSASVKEEMDHDPDFDDGLAQSYKPTLPNSNHHSEDSFFADLGEIETDPLDLLFTQNKDLDPFSFYDWGTGNGGGAATTAAASYGEANGDSWKDT